MSATGDLLAQHLRRYCEAIGTSSGSTARILVEGLPSNILEEVFLSFTRNGTKDLEIKNKFTGEINKVPVLLISNSPKNASGSGVSAYCTWDYAVSIRNSFANFIIFSPIGFDMQKRSVLNATEGVGCYYDPECSALKGEFWELISKRICSKYNLELEVLNLIVLDFLTGSASTDQSILWGGIEKLLASGGHDHAEILSLFGLPWTDIVTVESIGMCKKVLHELSEFVVGHGFEGIPNILATTVTGKTYAGDLLALKSHIIQDATTATTFSRSPRVAYRVKSLPIPNFYSQLSEKTLREILHETGKAKKDAILLTCDNQLYPANSKTKIPCVCVNDAHISLDPGSTRVSCHLHVKEDQKAELQIFSGILSAKHTVNHLGPINISPKPVRYLLSGPTVKDAAINVLILNRFAGKGMAIVDSAEKCPPPTRSDKSWIQVIQLEKPGKTDVAVYLADSVSTVSVSGGAQGAVINNKYTFHKDIDSPQEIVLDLFEKAGGVPTSLTLCFKLSEVDAENPPDYYSSLISLHSGATDRLKLPDVNYDNVIVKLEKEYLTNALSWRPLRGVIVKEYSKADFETQALGSKDEFAYRLPSTAKESVIKLREQIRVELSSLSSSFRDINLSIISESLVKNIESYVKEYSVWIKEDPSKAIWFDCIALHHAEHDLHAGTQIIEREPGIILLSPLHPIRLGWQVNAQKILHDSLGSPCPLAGLLAQHNSPDISAWPLEFNTGKDEWVAFASIGAAEPYWAVLRNNAYDGKKLEPFIDILGCWGIELYETSAGFTTTQIRRIMSDLSEMLPARAVLRCSLVGGEASSSIQAVEALLEWGKDSTNWALHSQVHIGSVLPLGKEPVPEKLDMLAEITDGRLKWFIYNNTQISKGQDIVIIDELGSSAPKLKQMSITSATSNNCLIRRRLRRDDYGNAEILESRDSNCAGVGKSDLTVLIEDVENLSKKDQEKSGVAFVPKVEAINARLEVSSLVAVTSSQLDLACLTRSIHSKAYLWDLQMPDCFGINDQTAGYYLISKTGENITANIQKMAEILLPSIGLSEGEARELLNEISARGIPILKELFNKGTHTRGELGVLMTARFLQDVFAEGRHNGIPVVSGNLVHMLFPVDPYKGIFTSIKKHLHIAGPNLRSDLVAISIALSGQSCPKTKIRLTPIEVKFRTALNDGDREKAIEQAKSFSRLLKALWVDPAKTALWHETGRGLLSILLDSAFRIYAKPAVHQLPQDSWLKIQNQVLAEVLGGLVDIEINDKGCVVAFDEGQREEVQIDDSVISFNMRAAEKMFKTSFNNPDAMAWPKEVDISMVDLVVPDTAPVISTTLNPIPVEQPTKHVLPATPVEQVEVEAPNPTSGASIVPSASRSGDSITPEIRKRVDDAFLSFVGNVGAINILKRDALKALISTPVHLSKSYLFAGMPSCGKTTLAKYAAAALGVPFIEIDGKSRDVQSREALLQLIQRKLQAFGGGQQVQDDDGDLHLPPFILFIDESHLMTINIQESMLKMLESNDRVIPLMGGQKANVKHATFIFATTKPSDMDRAFRTRCEIINLEGYTEDEIVRILSAYMPGFDADVYRAISMLSRRTPRVAKRLLQDLRDEMEVYPDASKSPLDYINKIAADKKIDNLGLTALDYDYMRVLYEKGTVGQTNLINLLGKKDDQDSVLVDIEPYLLSLRFISLTTKGRQITPNGKRYYDEVIRKCI